MVLSVSDIMQARILIGLIYNQLVHKQEHIQVASYINVSQHSYSPHSKSQP